jgi:sorbitol-specific phosphotransferase system component IIC
MNERGEVLMRIVVGIVSGIILGVWRWFIIIVAIVNAIYTLVNGKRMKELAEMSEIWNTQFYVFIRYLTFVSNKRPFPFENLAKNISKCDIK